VRGRLADFIAQSNTVSQASAAHRGQLAQNLQKLPPFLEQLAPAMEKLGRFAEETTPTLQDLNAAANGLNQAFTKLPAFSNSSTSFYESLGRTAKVSGPALLASRPLLARLHSLGSAAQPFAGNLGKLTTSLRDTGGLERLLDLIFLGTGATNGYDALGHFLRSEVVGTPCLKYAIAESSQCNGKLSATEASEASASSSSFRGVAARAAAREPGDIVMERTLAVLEGESPSQAIARFPGRAPSPREIVGAGLSAAAAPSARANAKASPVGGSTSGTTYYSPSAEGSEPGGPLLNYLLGN
jgi:hypothetical protein